MIVRMCFVVFLALLPVWADESGDRAKLMGQWKAADGGSWGLEMKSGDVLHVTRLEKDQKIADYECGLGKECEVQDSGRKVKVSYYFNGSKLVQFETKGSDVTKRQFGVNAAGEVMDVEVMPIVPSGKNETLQFQRLQITSATK